MGPLAPVDGGGDRRTLTAQAAIPLRSDGERRHHLT